jgi:hypothetical protein
MNVWSKHCVRQVILASNRKNREVVPEVDSLRHGRLCWEKKTMLIVSSFEKRWMKLRRVGRFDLPSLVMRILDKLTAINQ